ncbi:MAG TPA: hypothetical protein VEL79_19275 [Vicinamibacterales bacterium]|nr:hypothetical protein [Vicinamibacterales bacterium]
MSEQQTDQHISVQITERAGITTVKREFYILLPPAMKTPVIAINEPEDRLTVEFFTTVCREIRKAHPNAAHVELTF